MLVHTIAIDKSIAAGSNLPFTIALPNDCKTVERVLVTSNAISPVDPDEAEFDQQGKTAEELIRQVNLVNKTQLHRGGFDIEVPAQGPLPGGNVKFRLSEYNLGTVSLRAYDRNYGLFYNQSLSSTVFELVTFGAEDVNGNAEINKFSIRIDENRNKSKLFLPVEVDGLSGAITGTFEPSLFGGQLKSSLSDHFKLSPYSIKIYLLYSV